jgi:methionyl-tRNA formyltransferase
MRMDAGLDTGPVVAQAEAAIEPGETAPELEARLATMAAGLLRDHLGPWLAGEATARPQPTEGVTLARPFRRDDGRLDVTGSAVELDRRVRAFQPWPGSFVETAAGRLVLWRVHPAGGPVPATSVPGTFVASDGGLALAVGDGLLQLDEVQLAGARRMSGADLRRGRPGLVGSVVDATVPAGSGPA